MVVYFGMFNCWIKLKSDGIWWADWNCNNFNFYSNVAKYNLCLIPQTKCHHSHISIIP